ncbi:hypothetical protein MNB_SV-15-845 [hydrothermal vent metagenome]|uniref:Endonuclease GajA/Old nuclease/RecF-like AAA domain-containing protein n=1 Tax=hydrothermal vent metagenome TaxID=652676 RepID=A0A1W1EK74_9ZZZZ
MSEHFIKEIEIKNFKCFEDFKAEGFGRVNLIGGKNNVGKTAFMEALAVNVHAKDILTLFTAINIVTFQRNKLEKNRDIKEDFKNIKEYASTTNLKTIAYNLKNEDGKIEYCFKIDKKEADINSNEFSYQIKKIDNIYFLDNFGFDNYWLKEVYKSVQRKDKEEILYKYINEFDDNVEKFKIMGGESPECKLKGKNKYREINEFGYGLKHYISIICALYACENGYLFIDEIDNGIHYTQLDKLWEIILTISKEQNVQVFATTHSKECIESFNRVQEKLEDKDTYYSEMIKNIKTNKIFMRILDSNQLDYELTHKGEFRG